MGFHEQIKYTPELLKSATDGLSYYGDGSRAFPLAPVNHTDLDSINKLAKTRAMDCGNSCFAIIQVYSGHYIPLFIVIEYLPDGSINNSSDCITLVFPEEI